MILQQRIIFAHIHIEHQSAVLFCDKYDILKSEIWRKTISNDHKLQSVEFSVLYIPKDEILGKTKIIEILEINKNISIDLSKYNFLGECGTYAFFLEK